MRFFRSIPVALAALTLCASIATPAQARPRRAFAPAPRSPVVAQPLVTLSVGQPGAGDLPSFMHLGSMYYAGTHGERYDLRLTNNTAGRLEVVVTVDGRDVVSGEEGNYKRQRGYVLEPYATVVVDGFRQSYDQVAAFRFSDVAQSYTARRGTPQHAGVIGVAVFKEKRRTARRHRKAIAPPPPPTYEPYYQGSGAGSPPDAFPENRSRSEAAEADAPSTGRVEFGGDFAPAPTPQPTPRQLGTGYGESQYSAVQEVPFRRHRRRRPDGFLTVYYDSMDGLAARGVLAPSQPVRPIEPIRRPPPIATPGFAAPPPR